MAKKFNLHCVISMEMEMNDDNVKRNAEEFDLTEEIDGEEETFAVSIVGREILSRMLDSMKETLEATEGIKFEWNLASEDDVVDLHYVQEVEE